MEESTTTIALVMSLIHVVVELWLFGLKVVVDRGALEVMTSCKLCLLSWHFYACLSPAFIIAVERIFATHLIPGMMSMLMSTA